MRARFTVSTTRRQWLQAAAAVAGGLLAAVRLPALLFPDEPPFVAPEAGFSFRRCPTSIVYGGEILFSRARSLMLVPVVREIRYKVSPRLTV